MSRDILSSSPVSGLNQLIAESIICTTFSCKILELKGANTALGMKVPVCFIMKGDFPTLSKSLQLSRSERELYLVSEQKN